MLHDCFIFRSTISRVALLPQVIIQLCSLRSASRHPSFSHAHAVAEDSHPWRSGMKVKRSIDFVKPSLFEASALILPTCSLAHSTFLGDKPQSHSAYLLLPFCRLGMALPNALALACIREVLLAILDQHLYNRIKKNVCPFAVHRQQTGLYIKPSRH